MMNKLKMCSTVLVIRHIHIKNKVKYYFLPIKMSIVKHTDNILYLGCEKAGTLIYCW